VTKTIPIVAGDDARGPALPARRTRTPDSSSRDGRAGQGAGRCA
jgi:hypothetical protein